MNFESFYSIIYLEINIFAIILVCIIMINSNGMSRMVAQRNFTRAIFAMIIFFASDALWVVLENGFIPFYSKAAILITKDIYFFFTSMMCYSWFIYFEFLQDSPLVKSKRNIRLTSTFVWVQLILIIVNHFTGILYYITADNHYTRGPFFISLYLFSYVYVIYTCSRAFFGIFNKNKTAQREKLLKLAFFPVLPAIGGITQFIFPKLPVVCMMLALATLILYLDWINEMISVDPLTRLNNRKQFVYNYEQMLKNNDEKMPVYLLMIDANKFKEINDTYGHVEGDMALIRIADALRAGCKTLKKRATIARYGGDEFVILTRADKDETVLNFMKQIETELEELNKKANAPYNLTVSIGMAKMEASEELPLKLFVEQADEKLYEVKKKIKATR